MNTITLEPDTVLSAIARRSFCTLATTSENHRPHVAGVLYATVDSTLYVSTGSTSRKARNVAINPSVAVAIPVRRMPVGPPSSIQFQATADVLGLDDPHITALVDRGELTSITSHGELDDPENCFLRIAPTGRVHTYGLGMTLWSLFRDPLNAGGVTRFA